MLRYIFFHHQTTTTRQKRKRKARCVISSFITKPQPIAMCALLGHVALYLLSSPNHNHFR